MDLTAKQKYELKKFVKELEECQARHTELITVYIPSGYDLNKINHQLSQEKGTATNIKSASTRTNVIDGIEKMLQHLKLFKRTPSNGLAVFSGNVAEQEGKHDVKVWSLEPPIPLKTKLYRCDKRFMLDILRDMIAVKEMYGLIVMDKREGDLALLRGKSIVPIASLKSNVPGKHRSGGQSAQRFERLRDEAAQTFYQKIASMAKDEFLPKLKDLKGILVGGPGRTKQDFVDGGYLTGDLQKKVISMKDLSYTGDFGLQELVDKSQDVLAKEEIAREKQVMSKFFELLATEPGKVAYGYDEVKKRLEEGVAEQVLLSEACEDAVIEELEKIAEQFGTEVEIISTETMEGAQLRELGKIGAVLRYAKA